MGRFVVREVPAKRFEHCGRFLVEKEALVVFIDGTGRFLLWVDEVRYGLIGLSNIPIFAGDGSGQAGEAAVSASGKGFYFSIRDQTYVIPVRILRRVLAGNQVKGPVFVRRG